MNASVASPPLILTLSLDDASFHTLDALRRRHFPPERNFIPAHVTLFHALPGEKLAVLQEALWSRCARTIPFPLRLPQLRFLGRGTAAGVEGQELLALRAELAREWRPLLTAQDGQGYRPHVTLQNKVAPAKARLLYEHLSAAWEPLTATGEGLLLWRYLGGPWELIQRLPFHLPLIEG